MPTFMLVPQSERFCLNSDLFCRATITTKVVRSNPVHGEVYSIQYYVIKFISDLRQVGGFLRVLRFPPIIKLTAMT
jgi:hypothetical protein